MDPCVSVVLLLLENLQICSCSYHNCKIPCASLEELWRYGGDDDSGCMHNKEDEKCGYNIENANAERSTLVRL